MKANARDIVVQSYNLACSDEMLSQWRTENRRVAMSDEKIRAKDRKSTRLNSSHSGESRMPSSA